MTVVVEVINYIIEVIDTKECVELTTSDLSKAFDLVDDEILLEKLQFYDFRGKQLELLRSFLENRGFARFYFRAPFLQNIFE